MVRGRKPLATAVKEASGALAKNPQRRNKQEPQAKRGWPTKPDYIREDSIASKRWDYVCEILDEQNILTTADQSLIELHAIDYSQYRWLLLSVREGKVSIETERGSVVSPEAAQIHKYADRIMKQISELGLTPSSRSRLKVTKDINEDPFTAWLESSN